MNIHGYFINLETNKVTPAAHQMKANVCIEIPFKEWLLAEAAKLNIKPHTLEMRLHRGKHLYPAGLQRGRKRAVAVVMLKEENLTT